MDEWFAQVTLDGDRYIVGPFDSGEEADAWGAEQPGRVFYWGLAARRSPKTFASELARERLDHAPDGGGPRTGVVTRWREGDPYGFIDDGEGRQWFASRDELPGGCDRLAPDTPVAFGGPTGPLPGKKYPVAYQIRPLSDQ